MWPITKIQYLISCITSKNLMWKLLWNGWRKRMILLTSCQLRKDGGPRENSKPSLHLLNGKLLSSERVSRSYSFCCQECSEGKMLRFFWISGFPLFIKTSQVYQHWIGVSLFHLVLISSWRKLRRNTNFACLHTYWMWCVLVESILLLVGYGSPTFR